MSDNFPVYWFWATVCASTRDNRYNCALPINNIDDDDDNNNNNNNDNNSDNSNNNNNNNNNRGVPINRLQSVTADYRYRPIS